MDRAERNREREKAWKFFSDLDTGAKWTIGDHLVLGTFNWKDWGLPGKPSLAFLSELDRLRMLWEDGQE
ncbi:MAG: hypothetical protein FJ098_04435 [Deltaproteobacteria bacterium]|nr:hypothetical protein [Deltaproteobacteria bacterium]